MIGEISAAYIRGRRAFLSQQPARADREATGVRRQFYSLGYHDARRQARRLIVQTEMPLDTTIARNGNVPVSEATHDATLLLDD